MEPVRIIEGEVTMLDRADPGAAMTIAWQGAALAADVLNPGPLALILPLLRQEQPHMVSRFAACLYWAVIELGDPADVGRYERVFGAPPDDPLRHHPG